MSKSTNRTVRHIVERCEGCACIDVVDGTCTVFVDPAWQHRGGQECWGRCDTAAEMVERLEAVKADSTLITRWAQLAHAEKLRQDKRDRRAVG